MNESFSPSLKSMMDFYNADPSADNLQQLRTKIDDTKSVMVENIDQVRERETAGGGAGSRESGCKSEYTHGPWEPAFNLFAMVTVPLWGCRLY